MQWKYSISENNADFENVGTDIHDDHRSGRVSTHRADAKGARVDELISRITEDTTLVLLATLEFYFGIVFDSARVCKSPISLVSKLLNLYQDEQNEMNLTNNDTALNRTSKVYPNT